MKNQKHQCDHCEIRGYSSDYCKLHRKRISAIDIEDCHPEERHMTLGRKAVMGAGVGVVAATVGVMAAAPAIGLKTLLGHALAVKLTAGGGVAGAGINTINTIRGVRRNQKGTKRNKKRRLLLPIYLKKGS
ncbi:MAG: hypothetical protein V3S89_15040 [Desulfobacterales bacterium]